MSAQVLDGLRELEAQGAEGFLAELIDLFMNDLPGRCEAIRNAVLAGDADRMRTTAHALKGSAGNLGALPLQELCARLEAAARSGALADAPALARLIPIEAERVRTFLGGVRERTR